MKPETSLKSMMTELIAALIYVCNAVKVLQIDYKLHAPAVLTAYAACSCALCEMMAATMVHTPRPARPANPTIHVIETT